MTEAILQRQLRERTVLLLRGLNSMPIQFILM